MSKLIIEVCKIKTIEKHPNADKLSIVQVKGWHCIVGLNQYKPGDLVVFCPPDSVIPTAIIDKYKLEYLRKNGRIKTVKLRKFISQGLILDIPEGKNWKEGKDVAKELGIKKYEPPISSHLQMGGRIPTRKKRNPLFDKYTDIKNIKNYDTVFNEGDRVVITEKIHGTNFRAGRLPVHPGYNLLDRVKYFIKKYILHKGYEFVYGSHNVQKIPFGGIKEFYGEDVYGKISKKYKLADIIPEDYIVYGEIYGQKIQELTYGIKDIDVRIFDVKYKGKYLNWAEVVEFCLYRNLPIVPVLAIENYNPETLKNYTKGNSKIAPNQIREGCVIKPLEEEYTHRVGRKILKSINPEYLVKKDRTEHH